jgi:alpha-D-xyloside xylohydrolase
MAESEKITAIAASLLKLRMKLLPYLYTAFWRYHTEGLPPVRALVLDYPDDGRTHSIDDQYMLGDSLLVAPVFWGQNSRTVFLPEGGWYDFWTHEKIEGGRTINYDAPLEVIPVFVKSGSILPLAEPLQSVEANAVFDLTIFCFGSGEKSFTLYEDDGTSLAYEKGKYNTVILSQNASGKGVVSRTGTEKLRYDIREWNYIK